MPGVEKNYDLAFELREQGWNSLIFHYRGCWGSEGLFTFRTIPADVENAVAELCSGRYPQIDQHRLVLIGHSLGGWAAVLVGARDTRVKAVIAIAPIAVPGDFPVTIESATHRFCPWLPGCSPQSFFDQWNSLDPALTPVNEANRIAPRPLLILHGGRDELVSVAHSQALYAKAGKPKELVIHPDGNHSLVWQRPWLRKTILDWLHKVDDGSPGCGLTRRTEPSINQSKGKDLLA